MCKYYTLVTLNPSPSSSAFHFPSAIIPLNLLQGFFSCWRSWQLHTCLSRSQQHRDSHMTHCVQFFLGITIPRWQSAPFMLLSGFHGGALLRPASGEGTTNATLLCSTVDNSPTDCSSALFSSSSCHLIPSNLSTSTSSSSLHFFSTSSTSLLSFSTHH